MPVYPHLGQSLDVVLCGKACRGGGSALQLRQNLEGAKGCRLTLVATNSALKCRQVECGHLDPIRDRADSAVCIRHVNKAPPTSCLFPF